MINIEISNQEFKKYVHEFDLSNKKIIGKMEHSIRVQNISKVIAEDLKLQPEEVKLAMLIGLIHDIGRFEQEKQYHTFVDSKSFDHGDFGASLLENDIRKFINTNIYDDIIIKAVKNHNKLMIDETLNEQEKFYAEIVRDADKLDIIYGMVVSMNKDQKEMLENSDISEYAMEFIRQRKQVKISDISKEYYLDKIVRAVGFIFDVNFKKSFEILAKEDYINRMIDKYEYKNEHAKNSIEEVRRIANEYIKEKLNKR